MDISSTHQKHSPMLNIKHVTKRNGKIQDFDLNKIHRMCEAACEGIDNVSVSEIEIGLSHVLRDGMSTQKINEQLNSVIRGLISSSHHNYDKVGGRVVAFIVRKEVYGGIKPWPLKNIVAANIWRGRYEPELLSYYSDSEWDQLEAMVDHNKDFLFRQAGADQMRVKYLVKDRVTGELFESFQVALILIAAVLHKDEPKDKRLGYVKDFYDLLSDGFFSLPTPNMAGIRTIRKQGASCVLIDPDDSLDSIGTSDTAALKYIADKAGLGINIGRNRGIGAPIRGGDAVHTGVIPFIKKLTTTVKSCSQGGVRDGAVTFSFPMWHYEFPELVVLQDATLNEEQTNRSADYCVQINKFLLTRLIKKGDISLFSPFDVPGLYDAFFSDQEAFAVLYEKYEADSSIRRRTFSAVDLFEKLATQRSNTSRIYVMFVDNVNNHGMFTDPVVMTNLCCEILQPTSPLQSLTDGWDEGAEISLCNLAAINWGKINKPEDFERIAKVVVRGIDNLLDYQEYAVKAAREGSLNRRNIGIGIAGFAHFLAKKGLRYHKSSMQAIDVYAEAWGFYLLRASVDLAIEKGPCPAFQRTKYSQGITPNMMRTKTLDELLPHVERQDWVELREDMKKYGIRNSAVMALMPGETSSQIINATNGMEPPRKPITNKTSGDLSVSIVVPDYEELKNDYDWLWQQQGPRGYMEATAVVQKYVDQGFSLNDSYNPAHYPDNKISTSMILKDLIYKWQLGHKTSYYQNLRKPGQDDIETSSGCDGGGCSI